MTRKDVAFLLCLLLMLGGPSCRRPEFLAKYRHWPAVYVSRMLSPDEVAKELPKLVAQVAAESAYGARACDYPTARIAPGDCGELARHPVLATLLPSIRLYVCRVRIYGGWGEPKGEVRLIAVSRDTEYLLPVRVHQLLMANGVEITERNTAVWMRAVAMVAVSCRHLPAGYLVGSDERVDGFALAPFTAAVEGRTPVLPAVDVVGFRVFREAKREWGSSVGWVRPLDVQAVFRVGSIRDTAYGVALTGHSYVGRQESLWPLDYMDFGRNHGYDNEVHFDEY